MDLKNLGPDAKYIGQSGGKIRIESGDEELTFTEEEFYNTMGEANSADNL
jgi:hypothetical protein